MHPYAMELHTKQFLLIPNNSAMKLTQLRILSGCICLHQATNCPYKCPGDSFDGPAHPVSGGRVSCHNHPI